MVTLLAGLARWPPLMAMEPLMSGTSWSSMRNKRKPFDRVTCSAVQPMKLGRTNQACRTTLCCVCLQALVPKVLGSSGRQTWCRGGSHLLSAAP